jgi:phospholipase A1/A2
MKTSEYWHIKCCLNLAGAILFFPGFAFSHEQSSKLTDCVDIADNHQRLTCFDRHVSGNLGVTKNKSDTDIPATVFESDQKPVSQSPTSDEKQASYSLARHWELDSEHKLGTFRFRPHNNNYILFANYSSSPNSAPYSPTNGPALKENHLSNTEVKYQLSFKMKLLEDAFNTPVDLWFGYTQESNWQLYNHKGSSPVRETDYQPELMLVMPLNFDMLGMHARFFNLGMIHQSNGRDEPLSRSWNRASAQLGIEKDNFTLTGRLWKRLYENRKEDDNPDITDYMGYGDVVITYRWSGYVFSVLARNNFNTGHGATQVGWGFPLAKNINGYMEAFSGYGQSLIDYNHTQKTIGLGLIFNL